MDSKEFKKFVIECAEKILSEGLDLDENKKILKQPKPPKLSKPSFTKKNVNKMPKAPKNPKAPKFAASVTVAEEAETLNESKEQEIFYSPEKIKTLAEEMKKINKKIDMRNPLINPELFDIISEETILKESEQTKRWKNLYSYKIPDDNNRLAEGRLSYNELQQNVQGFLNKSVLFKMTDLQKFVKGKITYIDYHTNGKGFSFEVSDYESGDGVKDGSGQLSIYPEENKIVFLHNDSQPHPVEALDEFTQNFFNYFMRLEFK